MNHDTPPTTVKESLARLEERFTGFQTLIDERTTTTNKNIERLTEAVENMASHKADQKDLEALAHNLEEHKLNTVTKTEFRLGMTVITVGLSTIIAILTIWEKIKG